MGACGELEPGFLGTWLYLGLQNLEDNSLVHFTVL